MHSLTEFMKKISLIVSVVVLSGFTVLGSSGLAFADDPAPCVPPADSTYGSGIHHPTGSDSASYTYDCDTGLWSNGYYTFNPVNGAVVATYAPNYKYNCDTGVWTKDKWDYNPTNGSFYSYRVATGDPGLATDCPVPVTPPASTATGTTGTTPESTQGTSSDSAGLASTGPNSTNSANGVISLNGTSTNNTGLGMNNIIISTAGTGNASVSGNTTGGSASTGDAQTIANIANLLQSTSNAFGPQTTVFTADINGDVNGDFMFDPSAIMNTGPNSSNSANNDLNINTNNSNTTNAQINNNIDVGATTGNANVTGNTTGGDATSGNAQAVVNLMNLINSTVAAGQSFIGTININGSLNGDILLPQGVIDQLLASTGPNSSNNVGTAYNTTATTTNTTTETVANNLQSSAITGSANVRDNTTAGSATSGQAQTGVTILNLTGSNTIGKNSLLVFVNVLGKWVGMIMNAPSGTNAAQLGGGITSTGPNSTNTAGNVVTASSTTTNNTNLGINNDINVHAKSGNATVADNTTGGSAKTGNASTAVNILNLLGSNISLSDWFGVLFINVFGMWNGSFGVNTSAGDPVSNPTNNPVQAANQAEMLGQFRQFASFAAHGMPAPHSTSGTTSSGSTSGTSGEVLASSVTAPVAQKFAAPSATSKSVAAPHASFLMPAIGAGLALLILAFSERGRFFGKKN
jgi:hypothetical protein